MTDNDPIQFERATDGSPLDETDVSLRAYLAAQSAERLSQYDPAWTDDEVITWDGNFKSDGSLMLVCCERDVEIDEYRQVLEEHLRRRGITR